MRKGGEKFDLLIVSNQIFDMSKTETTNSVKWNPLSGNPKEQFLFSRAVLNSLAQCQAEEKTKNGVVAWNIDWISAMIIYAKWPAHSETTNENEQGFKTMDNIDLETLLLNAPSLKSLFGYSYSDLDDPSGKIDSLVDPDEQIPIPRDIYGRTVELDHPTIVRTHKMFTTIPAKLIQAVLKQVAASMKEFSSIRESRTPVPPL